MEEKQIPQAWIGQDLILCRAGAESWELVTLRQVNELGLAYTYKAGEVAGETVFITWSSVRWVRPPIPQDLEKPETEAE
jgi:hypothetical protein